MYTKKQPRKLKSYKLQASAGFTLIEIILSLTMIVTLLGTAVALTSLMLSARVKQESITETERQGAHAMLIAMQAIRNAESVTSPAPGTSADTLILATTNPSTNPTTIDVSSGAVRIAEGAGDPVFLTNTYVQVSNLTFTNTAYVGSEDIISMELTLNRINNTGRNEYAYEQTFYNSASLR